MVLEIHLVVLLLLVRGAMAHLCPAKVFKDRQTSVSSERPLNYILLRSVLARTCAHTPGINDAHRRCRETKIHSF